MMTDEDSINLILAYAIDAEEKGDEELAASFLELALIGTMIVDIKTEGSR